MSFKYHRAAIRELNDAIDFYEKRKPGLGLEFSNEIHATIQDIVEHPESNLKISRTCRRCRVRRFPYGIIYLVLNDGIVIIAVMHLNRRLGY
jgi:plasmid stabilization system protein ParE